MNVSIVAAAATRQTEESRELIVAAEGK